MGDAVAVLARVDQHIAQPSARDAFWERFALKLARVGEPGHGDALYLVCANVYYIADLFQARADADGLTLLARLEEECC
jgi:hypothetical protein